MRKFLAVMTIGVAAFGFAVPSHAAPRGTCEGQVDVNCYDPRQAPEDAQLCSAWVDVAPDQPVDHCVIV